MNFLEGEILYIDKPLGWTSFDVVKRVRGALSRRLHKKKIKVGHAGTLDPLASGVMVVVTGKATKSIEQLQAGVKEYVAEIKMGATTPSFDLETQVDQTYPTAHITQELINSTLQQFKGEIQQIPPKYSACKIEGRRAYDFARNGEEPDLAPKILKIDEIELLAFDSEEMKARVRVVCSKGTYIRALARDIGQALSSGAHLTGLRRTRVGNATIDQCITPDQAVFLIENAVIEETEEQNR